MVRQLPQEQIPGEILRTFSYCRQNESCILRWRRQQGIRESQAGEASCQQTHNPNRTRVQLAVLLFRHVRVSQLRRIHLIMRHFHGAV